MCQEKEAYMRAMALEYECNQGEFTSLDIQKMETSTPAMNLIMPYTDNA